MKKLALLSFAAFGIASLTQAASASVADQHGWKPVFVLPPAHSLDTRNIDAMGAAGTSLPTFSSSIKSPLDGNTYNFTIVGSDPTKKAKSTTVQYVPISIRWHFPNGVVLDPTQPGCNDTVSVNDRFFGSPLFVNTPQVSNGVNVGNTQVIDAFQRAEFWSYVSGKKYHVLLKAKNPLKPIIIDETAPSGSASSTGACSGTGHNLGQIPINAYDALLVAVTNKYATPNQLPIIMSYNVVETSGGCCIIGYHNAYNRNGGIQVYATGAYTDAGIFQGTGIQDIHAWTHEIGEAFNDPFINNGTPAWGHVGQVGGCQNNFEVGDPLTGTPYLDKLNGFTYHPQELAFFSWFYRQNPSVGTAGKYSFEGTFTSAQGACH